MADPRLNSIHLTDVRREEFRQARDALLQARGFHTLCATDGLRQVDQSHTFVDDSPPVEVTYWLAGKRKIYPLKVGVNTVGRATDNDVVVEDGSISRRHCAILVHIGKGCELHDTASKNGTYLNGTLLAGPTKLKPGDEIQMCDQQLIFHSRPEASGDKGPRNDATLSD